MEYYREFDRIAAPIGREFLEWAAEEKLYDGSGKTIAKMPTESWPFADFTTAAAISIAYFTFVVFGRIIMNFLPSFQDLTYPLRFVYNIAQVMLCSYMTIEAGLVAYRNNYNAIPCNPFDREKAPIAPVLWLFYVSKIFDFFDTFFIITGKKWEQLSFLHVYHHLTIFMMYWVNTNIGYDGDIYLTICLNGFIHTVMYTYYFLSMHTKDIWWKKYLTMMQMVQFLTMNAQAGWLLHSQCQTFPKRVTQIYLIYIVSLFMLFLHFFIRSYFVKPGKKRKQA
mmetsp:Transcript_43454/g.68040  ORF Transcript_43454/g.68040 Transcript_43454/m.68040 type:complete len:280 (-) Transcript_43454:155-994(-)|eukprot:CAMPEP_0184292972 /NCGR_PEP_ID=MMETSP1049-20130417/4600_1 /TAXON_ID=77928 /ORGANISM="Proteomonas sulcata, Strain CCMP704" /LENGTH=279 /DNA_ID=CAMNT_0026600895 /DNA_START=77 /DNA_END=916 /DNA_ORIENTATION=-